MSLRLIFAAVIAVLANGLVAPMAQAGPLCGWLFGGRRSEPAFPVGPPIPLGNGQGYTAGFGGNGFPTAPGNVSGYAPWSTTGTPAAAPQPWSWSGLGTGYSGVNYSVPGFSAPNPSTPNTSTFNPSTHNTTGAWGTFYGSNLPTAGASGLGYSAMMPSGLTAATLPAGAIPQVQQPVAPMSFVPNFSSQALRAPTTYYRPMMTTDPNTGAQVVAMSPCTSYQYLTQRVPTFGQSAMYGSYQTPTMLPPARTIPGYTLPSGGIPLAQSAPSYGLPATSSSFSPYTTFQPALVAPQSAGLLPSTATVNTPSYANVPGYTTTPLQSTPYYSAPSGGSVGSDYSTAPVPGLTAPQAAPYSATPAYSTPTYSAPGYSTPGYSTPTYSAPAPTAVNPPATFTPSPATPSYPSANPVLPSSDPADISPTLPPYDGLRPQLRSIVPGVSGSESASARSSYDDRTTSDDSGSIPNFPTMSPIPAPEGLQKPRWNPGLLRETDLTALRPITRPTDYAGQSKKIVWASFEQPTSGASENAGSSDWGIELQPSHSASQPQPVSQPQSGFRDARNSAPQASASPPATQSHHRRYDNSGWRASK